MKEWITENWFSLTIAITSILSMIIASWSARTAKKALKKENTELKDLAKKFGEYAETQNKAFNYNTRVVFHIIKEEKNAANTSDQITVQNTGGYGEVAVSPHFDGGSTVSCNYAIKDGQVIKPGESFKITFSANLNNTSGYPHFRKNKFLNIVVLNANGTQTNTQIGINEKGQYFSKNL